MDPKKTFRYALLLLVCGSLAYLALQEWRVSGNVQARTPWETLAAADGTMPEFAVLYLSEGKDCATCENLARYTKEALDAHFADELREGTIAWRAYDMDQPEHAHFVTDYDLFTKSVVLVAIEAGQQTRWKNLAAVWDHVYEREDFIAYIHEETRAFIKATP